ncbi:nucleotidyltransferase domain-containing protein [Dactylosporangium sp. CA-092794]|uniref:nucleotidyltransferase domain-containing protein n=1 Tax=Dactylosporangium sp. CA-092794 TaxID=3239929 RepID=UPI003D8A090F
MTPDLDAWDAWPPRAVADRLAGLDLPWCVAAGWALDLFRGAPSRPHGDLEIAVPAAGFARVAERFPDCDFYVADDGAVVPATPEALAVSHQTWAWDRAAARWRLDVFREPHAGDVWICRRDARIRRPYAEIIRRTPDGVPYLIPEIALLFKAKHARDKDEADFRGVLPLLAPDQRRWLDDGLALTAPAHPWRAALAGP